VLEEAEHLMIKTREYEGENEQMSFGTTGENGFGKNRKLGVFGNGSNSIIKKTISSSLQID